MTLKQFTHLETEINNLGISYSIAATLATKIAREIEQRGHNISTAKLTKEDGIIIIDSKEA